MRAPDPGRLTGKVAVITGATAASEESSFVAGIELVVDGGMSQV